MGAGVVCIVPFAEWPKVFGDEENLITALHDHLAIPPASREPCTTARRPTPSGYTSMSDGPMLPERITAISKW